MGYFYCKHVLGVEPDKMTAEIYSEFLRTLAIAWACFAMGAALWHWRAWATFAGLQHCSKLLLLLSPVLLSAFGYRSTEAVRTAELLAQQPRASSVFDEAPRLVADVDTVTTKRGTIVEFTRFRTDSGRTETSGRVQAAVGRSGRSSAPIRQHFAVAGREVAGVVGLPAWQDTAGYGGGWLQKTPAQ